MSQAPPPDVPDHQDQSGLSVSFDQARCSSCGQTSNPPRHAVADFPNPTGGDPRGKLRCVDCYAEVVAGATPLSHQLARVLALELAGYSHEQISSSEGRSVTTVRKWAKRIRDEHAEEQEGSKALSGLFEYL